MTPTVNAFASPYGSVRVYSGLMDLMTDDELRGIIGHSAMSSHPDSAARADRVKQMADAKS